jgi:hypothetical protein
MIRPEALFEDLQSSTKKWLGLGETLLRNKQDANFMEKPTGRLSDPRLICPPCDRERCLSSDNNTERRDGASDGPMLNECANILFTPNSPAVSPGPASPQTAFIPALSPHVSAARPAAGLGG